MKMKIILLAVFLLFAVSPAQADAANYAFYRPYIPNNTGLLLYNTTEFIPFTPVEFDTRQDGLFALQPDGRFTTDYSGLVKVTGACVQGKSALIEVRVVIKGYAAPVLVAQTDAKAFSFVFPFVANDITIQAINYHQGVYDRLKCDIVFEVVG